MVAGLNDEERFKIVQKNEWQQEDRFAEDVLKGLTHNPKFLPPKYFYDSRGSQLFDQICELPEYYPTRTETGILEKYAEQIIEYFGKEIPQIIELGSGSATKTRFLIEACLQKKSCLEYVPIDISESALLDSARQLLADYPNLHIIALAGDYRDTLAHLKKMENQRRLFLWLGSTIGNFEPGEAVEFLKFIRSQMKSEDRFLVGADLQKETPILENAYNDARGVTAAFNMNLLQRINRELGGEFDLSAFKHNAFYNEDKSRIEMHLISLKKQAVKINALDIEINFKENESIHTENSYKFSIPQLQKMATDSGFSIEAKWADNNSWFCEILLKPFQ